jgi:hypothetical protein
MSFDGFAKKYAKQLEILTERILDEVTTLNDKNYEEQYDGAYEEAVYVLAAEKNVNIEE